MSYSRKLIYNPQNLYKSDINDLVEEEMTKGGPGSGIKGHKTFAEAKRHMRQQEDAKHGRLDKLRGHNQYWQEKYKSAKQAGHKEDTEHYRKLRDEAVGHLMNRLSKDDVEKGGPGSGKKGHLTSRTETKRRFKEHAGKRVVDRSGREYIVHREDKTHYHASDEFGDKVSIHRTQAFEKK